MDAIETALKGVVDAGELAGVVTLVWRGGEARVCAVGWRDIEAGLPMQRDSIFRIASMSKPIVSAAAMTMLQEGRFALEDPISRGAGVPEDAGAAGPRRGAGGHRPRRPADHLR
uniref:Beta-lactamase family protein n=1 Tax=Phenylobacterium glaciei TaxID=2803784 RepID=A0A974S845_9CAUL|nr:beta-lactamase family protein [Phenylobacterium glaciei]